MIWSTINIKYKSLQSIQQTIVTTENIYFFKKIFHPL